jgi:quercetin dioxygenase-like cupin family protein
MDVAPGDPSAKGPERFFTGDVWFDPITKGDGPVRTRVTSVRFAPGARTAWHSHALGQTLYVTEGEGLAQARGEDVVRMGPGDIVRTPPDEWHWHGAAPSHFMTHLSIIEGAVEDGRPETSWGDHVSDPEYNRNG